MATDDQLQQNLTTPFPHPPPFYKHFTPSNISAVQQIRTDAASNTSSTTKPEDVHLSPADVPPELLYLIPPAPPTGEDAEKLRIFDELPAAPPPAPTSSTPATLTHHVRSLLLHYLSLLGTLSHNPSGYMEILNTLHDNFARAHELVNEYRPYQARETLIEVLEGMVDRRKAEIRGLEEMKGRVDEVLTSVGGDRGIGDDLGQKAPIGMVEDTDAARRKEQARRVWSALDAI